MSPLYTGDVFHRNDSEIEIAINKQMKVISKRKKTHKHNTEGGDEIWRVAESLWPSIATIGAAETDQSEMSSRAIHQSRQGLSSKVKYKRYTNTKMR